MTGLFWGGDKSVDKSRLNESAYKIILANRFVRPVPGARLVDIVYNDPSPNRAQNISAAIAQAYIAANLDKRFEANSYAKTFLDDQLKQVKLKLEEADKTLIDFSEREQIVIVTEKSSIAENNLSAANTALGVLVSERIRNEQLWKQVSSGDAINLPQFLTNAFGTSSGTTSTPSTEFFAKAYPAMSGGFDAGAPAADRAFDAGAILGLAIAHAGKFEAAGIRDSIRKVTEPGGEVVHAGPQGIARALQLIREKKPVRYVGVIGAVQFDKNGDIVGPFRTWRINNGEVTTVGQMSVEDVQAIQARLPK